MTFLARTAVPVERYLIFQAYNQQHTSSFRDELRCLLNSNDNLWNPSIGIHFPSSKEFNVLPQHFLLQESQITSKYYQDILNTIHDICQKNTPTVSEPVWLILDMSWIKLLPNPMEQQGLFIQAVSQSDVLQRYHIIFHF